jgi:hypothetical protein
MLGVRRRRRSDTNISRRNVAVDDPSLAAEEVANSANNGTKGTDTIDSSEGLARCYSIASIIDRGTAV